MRAATAKLRRRPVASSSGLGRSAVDGPLQYSFTDSITNTTNSSEASPRRNGAPGGGDGGDDDREWYRSHSSQLEDSSSQALPDPYDRSGGGGGGSRHVGDLESLGGAPDGGDGASTYAPSSVTAGFGPSSAALAALGGAGVSAGMFSGSSVTSGRHSIDPHGKVSLLQLQRAIEKVMVSDGEMYAKLQAGLKGIHSLARETDRLRVARDVTGATCINQYVVVKTLGRGSYGKVKLCLNTLDGQLYAVKMMNRSCLLRTLQRPRAGLRKGTRRSLSANAGFAAAVAGAGGAGAGDGPASPVGGAGTVASPGISSTGRMGGRPLGGPSAASATAPAAASSAAPEEASDVNREIAILKKLDHPNVVKLFEVIDPPGSQYMMLVMEFLEKGPVLQTHGQAGFDCLPEEVAADYFRQAVAGLEYLHYHKVVHGDLKPENLLVSSNGELKISDFGCSRMADGKSSHQRLSGTPAFTAPELVSGNAADPFAADVWALGACLYCFVFGRVPYQGGSVLDVFKAISTEQLVLPDDVRISPALAHLFGRVFDKDPATRITLQEIMVHPWVTDEGRVPMRSCSELGLCLIEVTDQEQMGAIDRASVVSMIRARLKEKVFRAGEYLFQTGQPMNCVYFIMSGVVEITKTATAEDVERDASGGASLEHSFTVDIDESLMLDCSMAGQEPFPTGAVNGRLHIDRLKARDLRFRQRSCIMEGSEVVVEVKGPGQVVGEVFMQEAPPPCRYSARPRGDVLALKLTQENYVRALAAMYFEAENGSRASISGTTASGRPLPGASVSSPGLLGGGGGGGGGAASGSGSGGRLGSVSAAAAAAAAVAAGRASSPTPGGSGSAGRLRAVAGPSGGGAGGGSAAAVAAVLAAGGGRGRPGAGGLGRQAGDSASSAFAHAASSSGSLPGGASAASRSGSGRLVGASSGAGAPTNDNSVPLQLLGSEEATDDAAGPGA